MAWFIPIMIAFSGATPISVLRRPLYSPGAPSVDSVVEKVLKNPPDVPAAACILIFVASAGYNAAAPVDHQSEQET
eukprot:3263428-Rhodomonas_salina.2